MPFIATGSFPKSEKREYWEKGLVTAALASSFLIRLVSAIPYFSDPDPNSYIYSEFFINYSGGFVRRGLQGEIIYTISTLTGADPIRVIQVLCAGAFLLTAIFLISRFRSLNLSKAVLFTPLLLAYPEEIIRKDFMLYLALIVILLLVRNRDRIRGKSIIAIGLGAIMMLIHEPFIFWGLPPLILVLLSRPQTRGIGIGATALFITLFILAACHRGSWPQTDAIIGFWNSVCGPDFLEFKLGNSIGALVWPLEYTMRAHFLSNFHHPVAGWLMLPLRVMLPLLICWFLSSFLTSSHSGQRSHAALLSLTLFQLIMLLPMLTLLSCDQERIYQYLAMSTVLTYVIIPGNIFNHLPPVGFRKLAIRLDSCIPLRLKQSRFTYALILIALSLPYHQLKVMLMSIIN